MIDNNKISARFMAIQPRDKTMQTQVSVVKVVNVNYVHSSDRKCPTRRLLTILDAYGIVRTIYIQNGYKMPYVHKGRSIVLQEEKGIETRFVPKYTIWNTMAAYKKSTNQK